MAKMKIAKNEFDRVADNLSLRVKMNRLKKLYDINEILDVLGFNDDSMDIEDEDFINSFKVDSQEWENAIYSLGAVNGNFEQAIAMNKYLPV
jgi:hypothetical protein